MVHVTLGPSKPLLNPVSQYSRTGSLKTFALVASRPEVAALRGGECLQVFVALTKRQLCLRTVFAGAIQQGVVQYR